MQIINGAKVFDGRNVDEVKRILNTTPEVVIAGFEKMGFSFGYGSTAEATAASKSMMEESINGKPEKMITIFGRGLTMKEVQAKGYAVIVSHNRDGSTTTRIKYQRVGRPAQK